MFTSMATCAIRILIAMPSPFAPVGLPLPSQRSKVPGVPFRRRMSIIRRTDGTLLFFNAMPLEDALINEVTSWGKPSVLVVPHDQHMIDARAFAEKLGLSLYGPKACEEKVRARAPMAGTLNAVPADAGVRLEPRHGLNDGEPPASAASAVS